MPVPQRGLHHLLRAPKHVGLLRLSACGVSALPKRGCTGSSDRMDVGQGHLSLDFSLSLCHCWDWQGHSYV